MNTQEQIKTLKGQIKSNLKHQASLEEQLEALEAKASERLWECDTGRQDGAVGPTDERIWKNSAVWVTAAHHMKPYQLYSFALALVRAAISLEGVENSSYHKNWTLHHLSSAKIEATDKASKDV